MGFLIVSYKDIKLIMVYKRGKKENELSPRRALNTWRLGHIVAGNAGPLSPKFGWFRNELFKK